MGNNIKISSAMNVLTSISTPDAFVIVEEELEFRNLAMEIVRHGLAAVPQEHFIVPRSV